MFNTVTFYNFSGSDYDLSGHHISVGELVFLVDELSVQKTLIVPAGQSVTLGILPISSTPSTIGLWYPGTFPTGVVDFIQYGAADLIFETEAVASGRWVAGEFVQGSPPFERTSLNYSDIGASYWAQSTTTAPELFTEAKIQVTPNPFLDNFFVETDFTNGEPYNVILLDSKGMEVISMPGIREKGIRIKSPHLPSGTYYMKLESDKGIRTMSVVKQ